MEIEKIQKGIRRVCPYCKGKGWQGKNEVWK